MVSGRPGQFEVLSDGVSIARREGSIWVRMIGGGWPDPEEVVARLRARGENDPAASEE